MKIFDKFKKSSKTSAITQKNIEKSREEILANGKKFRYPFQYAKHRLVINAILISIVAVVCFAVVGWFQLYKAQNTSDVAFRFTKVLGLPVAKIDGVDVRYSDYLMIYRSSVKVIERQQGEFDDSDDSKRQLLQYSRAAMNDAEEYSYALANMNKYNISVTDDEVDELVAQHMTINGERRSEAAFEGIISDNFGLSVKEYRRLLMLSIARKKVSEAMDVEGRALMEEVLAAVEANGGDFEKVADLYSKNELVGYETTGDIVATSNLDGGRAEEANSLENAGDVSNIFVSRNGDAFYIVKLVSKTDAGVSYESIAVSFSAFDAAIQQIRDDGKVKEYITIEQVADDESEDGDEANEESDSSESTE